MSTLPNFEIRSQKDIFLDACLVASRVTQLDDGPVNLCFLKQFGSLVLKIIVKEALNPGKQKCSTVWNCNLNTICDQ